MSWNLQEKEKTNNRGTPDFGLGDFPSLIFVWVGDVPPGVEEERLSKYP